MNIINLYESKIVEVTYNKSEKDFIKKYGISVFKTVKQKFGDINKVYIPSSLKELSKKYNHEFRDMEDVFKYFGDSMIADVDTGEIIIDKNFK